MTVYKERYFYIFRHYIKGMIYSQRDMIERESANLKDVISIRERKKEILHRYYYLKL